VIRVRLGVAGLGRTRFAYSPLTEIAESLYLLSSRRVLPPYEPWLTEVRHRLGRVDIDLLASVVPQRTLVAAFFFVGPASPATSIDQQLQALAQTPIEILRRDLEAVWRGAAMPSVLLDVISDDSCGATRLADAVGEYWRAAIEPHWTAMRAVLDDDVAYRARQLTKQGVEGLLSEMHPELTVHDDLLRIDKKRHPDHYEDHDLAGTGMVLVPSIFVWPNVVFAAGDHRIPSLTYPARGIGNVWGTGAVTAHDDVLGALLGRSRAAILKALVRPHSTTELALRLGTSPPAVSQHLSVLRRSGLVVSWRSGRKVLYRRTPLAASVVAASGSADVDEASAWA
jgi:DNA-binding transcriptional ArsR family regulator